MPTVTEEHNAESKDEADERPEQTEMFGQKIPQMKKRIKAEVDKDI